MAADVMTRDDVRAFATKLEEFAARLSPNEQALLVEILHRAAAGDADDVEAHDALRSAIAAAVLAVAGAFGMAANLMADTSSAPPHHLAPAPSQLPHNTGQWVSDDKGGMEYIPSSTPERI